MEGKITMINGKNPLFLWSFSIAMLNYQRVTGFITIWIVRKNTLQFFPDLPHMNHRISIDLANKKNPTPTWKVCHKISHHGMPPTHSWDLGFLQSIGRVPGAVVGRPLWASSSSADWWLPGIGDPNIAIFGDPNGIEMDFTKKKRCCRKICWRFDEILPSQIGFVPKLFQKWCSRTCFERRNLQEKPDMGGKTLL